MKQRINTTRNEEANAFQHTKYDGDLFLFFSSSIVLVRTLIATVHKAFG